MLTQKLISKTNYRVFHGIGNQEQGCCEFVLGLLESQGILCDPKTGRKLLLGQKYSQINLLLKQAGGCEKLKIKIC